MRKITVVGIDLAGVPENPSGFALLSDNRIETCLLYSDAEIVERCMQIRPKVVAIDAPLSLPKSGGFRSADKQLIKRGLRVFPPMFSGMKKLTARGIRLAREMRSRGLEVIEIHPRTSGIVLFGFPERVKWISKLRRQGWRLKISKSEHEMDAVVAALTGMFWVKKKAEEVGDKREGTILIPRGLKTCV
jgi:predicted nuclease with RNAse H fold